MPIQTYWRCFCLVEQELKYTNRWVDQGPPTVCPTNPAHSILASATTGLSTDRNVPDARNPTVDDDGTLGYEVGDTWVNSTTQAEYKLIDKTTGAALWVLSATEAPMGATTYSGIEAQTSSSSWACGFSGTHVSPPQDGDYLIFFESVVSGSASNCEVEIAVAKNSETVPVTDSIRPRSATTKKGSMITTTILTGLTTADEINGLFRRSSGNGAVSLWARRITLHKM